MIRVAAPHDNPAERAAIIGASLAGRGALIRVRDLKEPLGLADTIAPEHLAPPYGTPPCHWCQLRGKLSTLVVNQAPSYASVYVGVES